MYKSHCSCTGNEQVSVFVQKETCNVKESESCCTEVISSCCSTKETNQCESHSSDCDCDKLEVTYIKLTNKVVKEEVKFTKVEPVELLVVYAAVQFNLWETGESIDFYTPYIGPPPIHHSSLEFLIQIQQLKIPHIA